jgi:hypothetical protein
LKIIAKNVAQPILWENVALKIGLFLTITAPIAQSGHTGYTAVDLSCLELHRKLLHEEEEVGRNGVPVRLALPVESP